MGDFLEDQDHIDPLTIELEGVVLQLLKFTAQVSASAGFVLDVCWSEYLQGFGYIQVNPIALLQTVFSGGYRLSEAGGEFSVKLQEGVQPTGALECRTSARKSVWFPYWFAKSAFID